MTTMLSSVNCLVLYSCLVVAVIGNDCLFKECDCDQHEILCQGLGLTMIPHLLGNATGYKILTIGTNNITDIPPGILPPNLVGIDLSENPVTNIDDHAFDDSQTTLESLSFSEANFTRIPDAFLHLQVLKSLTIDDTSIQDWNDAVMKNIALTVTYLELVNVSLTTWPNWIRYFTNLTNLSLESNSISFIPDDGLDQLANTLTNLVLNQNNLTSFPKTIKKLTALQSLYLENNKIFYTTWLPSSSTMVILSFTNSHLVDAQDLSNSLRPYAQTLTDIALDNNNLSEIPDLSFLTNVDFLDFTHNQLSNPFAGSLSPIVSFIALDYNFLPVIPRVYVNLTSLHSIQMTHNLVREIRGADIPTWVTDIELSYNLVTELTDTSFPENSALGSLILVSNPIVKISQNAFKNLQLLTSLNLQDTKLVRLPLALASLTKLNYLGLDGSLGLVCTCQEKSLAAWVLGRQIESSCGEVSISYFFEQLSPMCP